MKVTEEILEDQEIGTCAWCGDEQVPIYSDTTRCEHCDGVFIWCSVCHEEQHEDDTCRHIFRTEDCEYVGSGAWMRESLKVPLFRLFDLMPPGFPLALRRAIVSGQFYTWLIAPLIGSGGLLELNGLRDSDGRIDLFTHGNAMVKIGEGKHAEETADGYHWLASLYKRDTLKANWVTVRWIDEYRTHQWLDANYPEGER